MAAKPPDPVRAPSPLGPADSSEAAAPGIAAVLAAVEPGGDGAILDLGPGVASNLDMYARFARLVRFADVRGHMRSEGKGSVAGMLEAVPAPRGRAYDLVFAWDVLDRLFPEYRAPLVERLAAVTARGSRLHVVVQGTESPTPPRRFALLGTDRMRYQPTGPPDAARPPLLPAQVAALLEPFRVEHGFTLQGGLREYVAVRP